MRDIRNLGPLLQMSWTVVFSVLIPLGVGLWLDRRLGTAPLFILIGALIGILASTVGVVRATMRSLEMHGEPRPPSAKSEAEPDGKEDRA